MSSVSVSGLLPCVRSCGVLLSEGQNEAQSNSCPGIEKKRLSQQAAGTRQHSLLSPWLNSEGLWSLGNARPHPASAVSLRRAPGPCVPLRARPTADLCSCNLCLRITQNPKRQCACVGGGGAQEHTGGAQRVDRQAAAWDLGSETQGVWTTSENARCRSQNWS